MASKRRDIEILFEKNGFLPVRKTTHGVFYSDGTTTLSATHRSNDPRAIMNIESDIRRAVYRRTLKERENQVEPNEIRRRILVPPPPEPKPEPAREPFNPLFREAADSNRSGPGKRPKRYAPEYRNRIEKRVKELYSIGCTQHEMVKKLTEEGYKSPIGGPIPRGSIAQILIRQGLFRNKKKMAAAAQSHRPEPMIQKAPPPPRVEPTPREEATPKSMISKELILSVLTDPSLTDSKKIRLLMVYLD